MIAKQLCILLLIPYSMNIHEHTKHIEIDCHFVRDELQNGLFATFYVRNDAQLADIFTKALGGERFEFLLRKLGIRNFHAPT